MAIIVNNSKEIPRGDNVIVNGVPIQRVIANGVTVWEKAPLVQPVIFEKGGQNQKPTIYNSSYVNFSGEFFGLNNQFPPGECFAGIWYGLGEDTRTGTLTITVPYPYTKATVVLDVYANNIIAPGKSAYAKITGDFGSATRDINNNSSFIATAIGSYLTLNVLAYVKNSEDSSSFIDYGFIVRSITLS